MSVTIQRARPEDAPALIEYLNIVGGETDNLTFGAGEFPATVEEEAEFLRREAENPKSLMLTAWEGGRIVGNAHLGALSRRLAHRGSLGISVLREAWGRGVGSALMEEVIAHARAQGVEIIELEVRSDNPRAIRLYEKFGFVRIGHYPGSFKIGGEYFDCELMNLYL